MFFVGSRQPKQPRACRFSAALIAVIASIAIVLRHKRDPLRRGPALDCWRHDAWEGAAMNEPPSNDSGPEAQFGSKLRSVREQHGISMRELGRRTYRSHSSLVEYERGYRLAPAEVVRDYETALEIEPGTLQAERDKALAERATIGRDGTLPRDAATTPASAMPPEQADADDPAPRSGSDRAGPPPWRMRVAAAAGVVAIAATLAALTVGGMFGADEKTTGTSQSSPVASTNEQVSIAAPPENAVPRCWVFKGSADLKAGHTLVLGAKNLDNGDPNTYFEAITTWRGASGQGSWSQPMSFGTAAEQDYVLYAMSLPVTALAKMPNKTEETTWDAPTRPREATLLQTMDLHRIAGAGSC